MKNTGQTRLAPMPHFCGMRAGRAESAKDESGLIALFKDTGGGEAGGFWAMNCWIRESGGG